MDKDGEEKERKKGKRVEGEGIWVGGRLARGAEGDGRRWSFLKSNLGLTKKSQSISREVIGLYRVSVAASFSLSHVVSNCMLYTP